MSSRSALDVILEEWLQLTKQEEVAIESDEWPEVARCQARKAEVQSRFETAAREFPMEIGAAGASHEPIRHKVARIISQLNRNAEVLNARLSQAQVRQALLKQARTNLQRIRRSYSRPALVAAWHSYS